MHPTIGYELGQATAADLSHQARRGARARAGRSDGDAPSGGACALAAGLALACRRGPAGHAAAAGSLPASPGTHPGYGCIT